MTLNYCSKFQWDDIGSSFGERGRRFNLVTLRKYVHVLLTVTNYLFDLLILESFCGLLCFAT